MFFIIINNKKFNFDPMRCFQCYLGYDNTLYFRKAHELIVIENPKRFLKEHRVTLRCCPTYISANLTRFGVI